jgi:hypothetical protein
MKYTAMDKWVDEIKAIMEITRQKISNDLDYTMITTYWQLGKCIVENEQNGEIKAQYGQKVLMALSKRLTSELGKGYSKSNLYNMRDFYIIYPYFQTATLIIT